jgi:putative spermidine/putrescine transport system substrate-binding protein
VSFPKEGAALQTFGAVVPKKSAHKAEAYEYMNALLDPKQLAELCQSNFYSPASNKVELPGEMGARILHTAEQKKKLYSPDFGFLANNTAAMLEWWTKSFV